MIFTLLYLCCKRQLFMYPEVDRMGLNCWCNKILTILGLHMPPQIDSLLKFIITVAAFVLPFPNCDHLSLTTSHLGVDRMRLNCWCHPILTKLGLHMPPQIDSLLKFIITVAAFVSPFPNCDHTGQ